MKNTDRGIVYSKISTELKSLNDLYLSIYECYDIGKDIYKSSRVGHFCDVHKPIVIRMTIAYIWTKVNWSL